LDSTHCFAGVSNAGPNERSGGQKRLGPLVIVGDKRIWPPGYRRGSPTNCWPIAHLKFAAKSVRFFHFLRSRGEAAARRWLLRVGHFVARVESRQEAEIPLTGSARSAGHSRRPKSCHGSLSATSCAICGSESPPQKRRIRLEVSFRSLSNSSNAPTSDAKESKIRSGDARM
jgi:hypothetical protein